MTIKHISRLTLAVIWLYHGIVPKLIFRSEQEVLMNSVFMPFLEQEVALISTGILEIIYGILLLVCMNSKRLLYPAIGFSMVSTLAIFIELPELFTHAFNPFSINLAKQFRPA